jgi:outer membrane protein assembly factor BamB
VPEGKLPAGFSIPASIWMVNYEYVGTDGLMITTARDQIASFSKIDDTTLNITTSSDFNANPGDRLCMAVRPSESTQTILVEGEDLYVERVAKEFFPPTNGAININRIDYLYRRLVDEGSRVKLEDLSASSMPNQLTPFPLTVENKNTGTYYTGDFIVLSPRNHMVIPKGISEGVELGGTLEDGLSIYDTASAKSNRSGNPDIGPDELPDNISEIETNPILFTPDTGANSINIGGGGTGQNEFGGAWYSGDRTIGGKGNFCQTGACAFGSGIRVFFILDYSADGEGLTFALLNAVENDLAASGGDIELSELIGYAGDSRVDSVGSAFLDGTGNGLQPPKIALEFDTRPNNANFGFCADASTVNTDTRNDPLSGDRDAIQYVFWGFNTLAIPCRNNHPSYDDNRHDSGESEENWQYPSSGTIGTIRSTPAVADDGTIYVGSDDGHLYAINPDGTLKWQSVLIGAVRSSPAVGFGGVVYVGSDDGNLYAFQPDSASPNPPLYSYSTGGAVRSSPVIGAGGKVYVGSDDEKFYGLTPDLTKEWEFTAAGPISFGRPAVDMDGVLYISHRNNSNGRVYALNPAQRELATPPAFPAVKEWSFDIGDGNDYMPGIDPSTGIIYSDRSGNRLVAIDKNDVMGMVDATNYEWEFLNGTDIDSTPVVGEGGIVYFGDDNNKLFAINPADRETDLSKQTLNPTSEWVFVTGGEIDNTPAIAPDGTILVVSNDDNLYAVNPDGTEKWTFAISVDPVDGGLPNSSPTVLSNAFIYVGSSEGKLYSINDFAIPRNIKEELITSINDGSDIRVGGEVVTVDNEENWLNGSTSKGPWAIRFEVKRSLNQNADLNYEYTLHSWARQCNELSCNDILGTFFEDTRIEYTARIPQITQTIELDQTDHDKFTNFLYGFTSALAAGDTQSALIENLNLSFIRPNDPIVSTDPSWP